ncbi:MAG: YIP1 family protein [Clostridia bacterium]
MKLKIKRVVAIMLVLITLIALSANCFASTPYKNYIYDTDGVSLSAPPAATPVDAISTFGEAKTTLSGPQDLFSDDENHLYIADSGNNRILKVDKDYNVLKEYKTFMTNGVEDTFANPSGIFVDKKGFLYVADTDKQRVVKLNQDGSLFSIFPTPESQLLPADFEYKPIKIGCDTAGRVFVCSNGFNQGLLELDRDGKFVQMLGAPKVEFSFTDQVKRLFQTEEQRKRSISFVPREFNNVYVDKEDFVFSTAGSSGNENTVANSNDKEISPVFKLSAQGTDVLRKVEGAKVGADLLWGGRTYKGPSYIVDVLTMDDGIFMLLDQKRSRVFAYNNDGIMLFEFGGVGTIEGTVTLATALEKFDGKYIILDATKNQISRFENTDYANTIFQAEEYRRLSMFDEESAAWNKILSLNETNPLVLRQLGKVAYRQHDMKKSMEYYKLADDKKNYSKSYEFYRRELINKYFNIFGIILIIFIVLMLIRKVYMYFYRKTHPKIEKKKGPIAYAFYILFRPLDGFWDLKNEKRGNMKTAILFYFLAIVAVVFRTQLTGFIFQTVKPADVNIFADIATILLPCLLWVVASRCVTSLMDGEGSLKNIIIATGYSLTPIIILFPISAVLSNIFTEQEGVIVTVMVSIAIIWTLLLIFCSLVQTHSYTFGKAIGVLFISLVVIVIIMFIALLCFALLQQMYGFVYDLKEEILNR